MLTLQSINEIFLDGFDQSAELIQLCGEYMRQLTQDLSRPHDHRLYSDDMFIFLETKLLHARSEVYLASGEFMSAANDASSALALMNRQSDHLLKSIFYIIQAKGNIQNGDVVGTIHSLISALAVPTYIPDRYLYACHLQLGLLFFRLGLFRLSLHHIEPIYKHSEHTVRLYDTISSLSYIRKSDELVQCVMSMQSEQDEIYTEVIQNVIVHIILHELCKASYGEEPVDKGDLLDLIASKVIDVGNQLLFQLTEGFCKNIETTESIVEYARDSQHLRLVLFFLSDFVSSFRCSIVLEYLLRALWTEDCTGREFLRKFCTVIENDCSNTSCKPRSLCELSTVSFATSSDIFKDTILKVQTDPLSIYSDFYDNLAGVSALSSNQWGVLSEFIDKCLIQKKWNLLYKSSDHGMSFKTLQERVRDRSKTLFVFQSVCGHIVGAFIDTRLKQSATSHSGAKGSFVFSTYKHDRNKSSRVPEIYQVTNANSYIALLSHSCLSFGGGDGCAIRIDDAMNELSSDPCVTFASPALLDNQFELMRSVECWQQL